MVEARLLSSAGRRRSPASLLATTTAASRATTVSAARPAHHVPRRRSPSCATPAEDLHGDQVRALIVILGRVGPRIQEARSLTELDSDLRRGVGARTARQRRPAARDRHRRPGLRAHTALAGRTPHDPRRPSVLRPRRPHPRTSLVSPRGPCAGARSAPACGAASHHTNCATRTQSNSREAAVPHGLRLGKRPHHAAAACVSGQMQSARRLATPGLREAEGRATGQPPREAPDQAAR